MKIGEMGERIVRFSRGVAPFVNVSRKKSKTSSLLKKRVKIQFGFWPNDAWRRDQKFQLKDQQALNHRFLEAALHRLEARAVSYGKDDWLAQVKAAKVKMDHDLKIAAMMELLRETLNEMKRINLITIGNARG